MNKKTLMVLLRIVVVFLVIIIVINVKKPVVYDGSYVREEIYLPNKIVQNEISQGEPYGTNSYSSDVAIVNGYIYVGSENGFLYQLNANNVSQIIAVYTT
jgi:outer membrane protein assembly factor BamB